MAAELPRGTRNLGAAAGRIAAQTAVKARKKPPRARARRSWPRASVGERSTRRGSAEQRHAVQRALPRPDERVVPRALPWGCPGPRNCVPGAPARPRAGWLLGAVTATSSPVGRGDRRGRGRVTRGDSAARGSGRRAGQGAWQGGGIRSLFDVSGGGRGAKASRAPPGGGCRCGARSRGSAWARVGVGAARCEARVRAAGVGGLGGRGGAVHAQGRARDALTRGAARRADTTPGVRPSVLPAHIPSVWRSVLRQAPIAAGVSLVSRNAGNSLSINYTAFVFTSVSHTISRNGPRDRASRARPPDRHSSPAEP